MVLLSFNRPLFDSLSSYWLASQRIPIMKYSFRVPIVIPNQSTTIVPCKVGRKWYNVPVDTHIQSLMHIYIYIHIYTRWFSSWRFYPLIGGHLTIPKRSRFHHPKNVTTATSPPPLELSGKLTRHHCTGLRPPNLTSCQMGQPKSIPNMAKIGVGCWITKKWWGFLGGVQ